MRRMKRLDMLLSISRRLGSMIESLGSIGIQGTRREGRLEEGLAGSRGERILGPRMMRNDRGRGIRMKEEEEKGSIVERERTEAIEGETEVIGTEEIEVIGTEIVVIVETEETEETEATEEIGKEVIEAIETEIGTETIAGTETIEEIETTAPDEITKTERSAPRNPNASQPQNRLRRKNSIDLCF